MAFLNGLYLFVCFALWSVVGAQNATNSSSYDVLDYVNQLIGSSNGGWLLVNLPYYTL
jgi:hypothetical protein